MTTIVIDQGYDFQYNERTDKELEEIDTSKIKTRHRTRLALSCKEEEDYLREGSGGVLRDRILALTK